MRTFDHVPPGRTTDGARSGGGALDRGGLGEQNRIDAEHTWLIGLWGKLGRVARQRRLVSFLFFLENRGFSGLYCT